MTNRILDKSEWARLVAEPEMADFIASLNQETADIEVVESDGVIVAAWTVMAVPHIEGLWIRDDYRKNPAVCRKLYVGMMRELRSRGIQTVMTGAVSALVASMLGKVGARKAPDQFYMSVKCR